MSERPWQQKARATLQAKARRRKFWRQCQAEIVSAARFSEMSATHRWYAIQQEAL